MLDNEKRGRVGLRMMQHAGISLSSGINTHSELVPGLRGNMTVRQRTKR